MVKNSAWKMVPFFGKRLAEARERAKSRGSRINMCVDNMIHALVADQFYIHSVPKSGVTWTLLVIANYWATLTKGPRKVAFDELVQRYIPHSVEKRCYDAQFRQWLLHREPFFENTYGIKHAIHSHKPVKQLRYARALMLTRNPFDFLLSFYYFKTSARDLDVKFTEFAGPAISRYIALNRFQIQEAERRPGDCLVLSYETIKQNPIENFRKILLHTGVHEVQNDTLAYALKSSGIDEVLKFEREGGTVVAPLKKSFIRSGTVGGWRSQLSEQQISYIDRHIPEDIWEHLERADASC